MTLPEICLLARSIVNESHGITDRKQYIQRIVAAQDTSKDVINEQKRNLILTLSKLASAGTEAENSSNLSLLGEVNLFAPSALETLVRRKLGITDDVEFVFATFSYVPPGNLPDPFGLVKKLGDRSFEVRITYPNLCWFRFIHVKELMHVYTNFFDNCEFNVGKLHKCMEFVTRGVLPSESEKLDAEMAAFYLAIEVLLPWELRPQLVKMLDTYEMSDYEIAKAFMIPEYVVVHALKDNRAYYKLSQKINGGF